MSIRIFLFLWILLLPNIAQADSKVSAMTEDTTPSGTDLLYTVKDPATTPVSRRSTIRNVTEAGFNNAITANGTNIGVGTEDPQAKLDVNGAIYGRSNVGIGTAAPAAGLQVGPGSSSLGATLSSTGALIKGNLEVDGKIYGDGSLLTNTPIPSGVVTSVTGTYPVASTGGTAPVISVDLTPYPQNTRTISTTPPLYGGGNLSADRIIYETRAGPATDGYLAATDWVTFNAKQPAGSYLTGVSTVYGLTGAGTIASPLQVDPNVYTPGGSQWITSGLNIYYNTGNVGIGSTAPQAALDLGSGSIFAGSGTFSGSGASTIYEGLIIPDGNLGIGTTGYGIAGLQVGSGAQALSAPLGETSALIRGNLEVDGKIYGDGSQLTNLPAGSGTVTSVTGSSPIASSGGTTPNITISQSGAGTNGYLSSADWNTFNNKQPAGSYLTSESDTLETVTGRGASSTNNIGLGTTAPATTLQVGTGAKALSATLPSGSALVKGNLEVDGKIYGDGSGLTNVSGGAVGADPTAYIGLTSVTGSAATFTRSDGAPALSQGISPTWTGIHTFNNGTYSALFTGGNVGIGSATPGHKLDVDGTVYLTGNIGIGTSTPRARLEINSAASIPSGSNPVALIDGNLVVDGKIYGDGSGLVGIDTSGGDITGTLTTNKIVKGGSTSNTVNTDSNIWSIGTNGCVGIGDSTPDGVLEIVKSGSLKSLLVSSAASGDGDYLTVNSGGNIGIGTITPTWRVAIGSGTSSKTTYAANSLLVKGKVVVDGGVYGDLYGSATGTSGYWVGSGSPVNIHNNNTGNVGIGVDPLNEKLGVEGKIFLRDTTNNSAVGVNLGTHGASASYNASFQSNWTIPTSMTTASYILRLGSNAGSSVTNATYANFIGWNAGYYADSVIDSNYLGSFAGTNSLYGTREYFIGHYVAQYLNDGSTACTGTSGDSNADNYYIGNYGTCYDNDTQNSFNIGNNFKSAGDNKITIGGVSHTAVVFHGNTGGLGSGAMNVGINSRSPLAMLDVEGSVYIGVGNLGIGTTAPRQKMEINGSIRAKGYQSSDGTAGVTVTTCTSFKNGLCVGGT